jgi:hypothetical protein
MVICTVSIFCAVTNELTIYQGLFGTALHIPAAIFALPNA